MISRTQSHAICITKGFEVIVKAFNHNLATIARENMSLMAN